MRVDDPGASGGAVEGLETTTIVLDDQRTCLECGQTFAHASARNRHMRTHSGLKPFACFYCDYATDRKESLKSHCIKRHEMTPKEFKDKLELAKA